MKNPKVLMMGLGYIGLPTAGIIASNNIKVHGVDINQHVVDTINKGQIHIIEKDLDALIGKVVKEKYLSADVVPQKADVFLIAVPTPFCGNYEPDISFVEKSVRMILPFIEEGNLVIIESTSPVGTTEKMADMIFSERKELAGKISIAYCPERVLPGNVLFELVNNDRVIGGVDEVSTDKAFEFYSLFVKGKLHRTNSRTAEMCKLVENSYRDTNIAFANELSMICDKANINVWELIELANKHPRVKILQPGSGVGGHCIAVDPWFIVHDFPDEAMIIRTAREVNNHKSEWVVEKIKNVSGDFEKNNGVKPKIACLGLAFKPDIDDLRESPALHITEVLINLGFDILPVEPNIDEYKKLKLYQFSDATNKADIIALLVAHKEFKTLNISGKIILDFCGVNKNVK